MRRRGAERRMPQGCGPAWGIRNDIALWLRDTRSGAQCSTSRASVFTWGGLTRERGRAAMVAGHVALMDTSVPEAICLRSFLMPPQALPILPRVCERLIGDAALRSVLIVLLPSLVLAAEASPVPTGYDHCRSCVSKPRWPRLSSKSLPRTRSGGGRDGASSAGQQGSDNQALDFTPSGCAEETLKGCQDGATVG